MNRRKSPPAVDGTSRAAPSREPHGGEWEILCPLLTEERKARILEVLGARTSRLVLVLDNLFDPHNLSAVLRTAEAFGLQRVILCGDAPKGLNPLVALGAERWLTIEREPDASALLERLKASGHLVAASVLAADAVPLGSFHPRGPVAMVLGNEHEGVRAPWIEGADVHVTIPLTGFARSLNVSVAAGIFTASLLAGPAFSERGLPRPEADRLRDLWARQSVENAEKILAELRGRKRRSETSGDSGAGPGPE